MVGKVLPKTTKGNGKGTSKLFNDNVIMSVDSTDDAMLVILLLYVHKLLCNGELDLMHSKYLCSQVVG